MRNKDEIRLSPKHGVNPSLGVCKICFADTNEVLLLGLLRNDARAPHKVPYGLCDQCREHMAEGFLLVERKGNTITGNRWVVTNDAASRLFGEKAKAGACYVDPETAKQLGLYE